MNRRLASLLFLVLILCSAVTPLALGASWVDQDEWEITVNSPSSTNLTITPGASGTWVTGGYDFNATGYATSVGFRPLDDVTAASVIVWLTPDTLTGWQHIVSQYEGATSQVQLVSTNLNKFSFGVSNGTDSTTATFTDAYSVGTTYCVIGVFNGSHALIYVDGEQVAAATGISGSSDADADLKIGARTGNPYWAGKMYYVAFYSYALTEEDAGVITAIGPDIVYGAPSHYYLMNEGSGTTFYDSPANVWNHQDYWDEGSAVTNTPTYPAWELQDNYTYSITGDDTAPSEEFIVTDEGLGGWLFLIGALSVICSGVPVGAYLRSGGRRVDRIAELAFIFALMFLLGWGLMMEAAL